MQQSIAPPPPFVPNPASPDADWEQWKEAFEVYLDALEGESFTHKRKFAILRHCLGSEGRNCFIYIPKVTVVTAVGEGDGIEEEYETAIKSLDTRFIRCRNVTLERHQFYKRAQADGETASSYVGALRLLAVSCDYKEFEEEMIRDPLVEKTNNKKVQEALLSTPNLTLQKALEIANRIESTASFMEQMSVSENKLHSPKSDVFAVKTRLKKENKGFAPQPTSGKSDKKVTRSLECYICGSTAHLGNAKFCPAIDKNCAKCYKKGHFARVCKANRPYKSDKYDAYKVNNVDTNVSPSSNSSEEEEVFVVNNDVSNNCTRRPFCLVEVNGIQVQMMADSGSPFTLLSDTKWNELFEGCEITLNHSRIQPVGYGGKSVDVIGEFQANLRFRNNTTSATIYVAKDNACLLGWFDQGKLELVLDPNNPEQIITRSEFMLVSSVMSMEWESRYP
ncbi:hypothetical protein NDU88_005441 [Pleurodeles waltl]|uniref:CCHC-type domain-containing protein n=1 Tax=Pleurodeles waltl TaxID=8319 RepID=A0AAV7TWL8_PLEWA|nr:hypothetical protein NDU88_005441 [Pleurodeles waltl]